GPDQQVIEVPGACGVISHSTAEPGTPKPMWFAADRFWLGPLTAGADAGAAMDALLAAWHRTIAPELETAGPDSACYVTYPSREDQVFPALGRHGLTPHLIIPTRPAKAGSSRPRAATDCPRTSSSPPGPPSGPPRPGPPGPRGYAAPPPATS